MPFGIFTVYFTVSFFPPAFVRPRSIRTHFVPGGGPILGEVLVGTVAVPTISPGEH